MLSIAVQMDPIEDIKITKDTTFAFMLEAQRRGHTLWYYEPQNLFFDNGFLGAFGMTIYVDDVPGQYYKVLDQSIRDISSFNVVLVRQDPPFDMGYVANTYLLELASRDCFSDKFAGRHQKHSRKIGSYQILRPYAPDVRRQEH